MRLHILRSYSVKKYKKEKRKKGNCNVKEASATVIFVYLQQG